MVENKQITTQCQEDMVLMNKNTLKPYIDLQIDGYKIEQTVKTKFLLIIIDCQLTRKYHINYTSGKIAKGIGIIIKARKLLDQETLITLYYSFIYSYLCYCNQVWENTCVTHLQKLLVLQKRIVRILAGVKPRDHTAPLFKRLNILNTFEGNKHLIGIFIYHIYNENALDMFTSMFTLNYNVHSYITLVKLVTSINPL